MKVGTQDIPHLFNVCKRASETAPASRLTSNPVGDVSASRVPVRERNADNRGDRAFERVGQVPT